MAGSLLISEDAVWSPAGWVFDQTLDAAALKLQGANPELAEALVACREQAAAGRSGELDVRCWDRRSLGALAWAVDEVYARFQASGADAVYDRRFYPGLLSQLTELRALLHSELAGRPASRASAVSTGQLS